MNKFGEIRFPTEEEKNKSIHNIVANGMPKPQKLFCELGGLWHSVGFRGIFFGVEDCIFLSALLTGLVWACLFTTWMNNHHIFYVLLFLGSPFIYALLHLLTTWKEIMIGTYELKMACRYSLRQITALRMLVFGGVSVVLTVFVGAGIWLMLLKEVSVLRIMNISFSSLFFFAAIQLLAEWKWRAPASYYLTPAFWVAFSALLLIIGEPAEQLLLKIPTAVFWTVTVGSALLYAGTLKKYFFGYKEGALSHVVG